MDIEQTIEKLLTEYDNANREKRWERARQLAIEIENVLDSMNGDEVSLKELLQ